jgi:hypothetical protein
VATDAAALRSACRPARRRSPNRSFASQVSTIRPLCRACAADQSPPPSLRGQDGEAASFMAGPVMLFSLLIAVLWAWSLFTHPQTRCTRCTSAAPHLRPWHTRTSGTCSKCGGTGTRERLEVAALRTLGWDIGPTGGCGGAAHPPPEQAAGRASIPQPAKPRRPRELSWSALHGGGLSPPSVDKPRIPAQPAGRSPVSVLTTGRGHRTQVAAHIGGDVRSPLLVCSCGW